jgi:Putative auto-transporter adhesin, head GIN domain
MKKVILLATAIFASTFCLWAQDSESVKEKNKTDKKEKKKNKDWNDNGNWNNWGGGERIRGEGPSVTETRDAKNFKGFKSSISADITLKQTSGSYSVKIEGQKNILALLKTEVVDGMLKIGFEKGYSINHKEPLNITIEAPSFEYLGLSGSGNVKVNGSLSGDKMTMSLSGSGDFYLDELKYSELSVGISGSGNVKMSGTAESVDLSISGSGNLKANDLKAQKARCRISGSGNLSLNVTKELDATISGSGDIRYSGNPPSVRTKVSGSGDISSK